MRINIEPIRESTQYLVSAQSSLLTSYPSGKEFFSLSSGVCGGGICFTPLLAEIHPYRGPPTPCNPAPAWVGRRGQQSRRSVNGRIHAWPAEHPTSSLRSLHSCFPEARCCCSQVLPRAQELLSPGGEGGDPPTLQGPAGCSGSPSRQHSERGGWSTKAVALARWPTGSQLCPPPCRPGLEDKVTVPRAPQVSAVRGEWTRARRLAVGLTVLSAGPGACVLVRWAVGRGTGEGRQERSPRRASAGSAHPAHPASCPGRLGARREQGLCAGPAERGHRAGTVRAPCGRRVPLREAGLAAQVAERRDSQWRVLGGHGLSFCPPGRTSAWKLPPEARPPSPPPAGL